MNEEDVIELDPQDFGETPTDEVAVETTTEQTNKVVEETTNEETAKDDSNKLLEFLNGQGIKYNGENKNIESIDELKALVQKGLNYDKVKARAEEASSDDKEALDYIHEKAKASNVTSAEYIRRVKEYEAKQQERQVESDVQDMVSKGIDEATARRVAESEARLLKLEALQKNLEERENEAKAKAAENAEYEEFIKAYPDIDYQKIPKEVFEASKDGKTLLNAYREYENKQLKEKLKEMEQNLKNVSSSVVTPVTNGISTEQESKDEFLQGFDSIL